MLRSSAVVSLLFLLLAAAPAAAQTGVDDDRVSLPEGPGSLEGVGENADVDPNMGLMRWGVPIEVLRGQGALTPQLQLGYSSGGGSGIVGMGWSLAMPSVERWTARGVPSYTASDRLALGGGEELVEVGAEGGARVYRERYERGFSRVIWEDAGAEGWFRVEYPDGRVGYFGADAQGQVVPDARTSGEEGTYRYHLVEVTDPWGHRVRYSYDRFDGNVPLVTSIAYTFVGGQARSEVVFGYEGRPDAISECGAGFEEVLGYRLASVQVLQDGALVREYGLTYETPAASGGASRLASVRTYGLGGAAEGELSPGVWSFGYSQALGGTCDGAGCARPVMVDMGTLEGAVSLASGNATLIDINGDSLPDVLDTSGVGPHRFLINTLTPDGAGGWEHTFSAALESQEATGSAFQLTDQNVQVLDLNGDGYSDLIDTVTGSQLLNDPRRADWGSSGSVEVGALPSFTGTAFEQLRFIDADNDKRIDVIQSTSGETRLYFNRGGVFEAATVEPIGAGFETSNLQLSDMNGDGLNDPVEVLSDGGVRFRVNLGRGRWGAWQTIPGLALSASERPLVDLEDLNGDGLSDVVVVVGTTVKYALNRNAAAFAPFVTLTSADVEGEVPERADGVLVLYADMNGNGSEDVVWFTPSGGARYLELFPTRPNLLTKIENGLGMVQEITYGTSVEHAARAAAAGTGWEVALPNATAVVDRIDLYVTLTGADDGSGVHEVTEYTYRNGYYDGEEKQFRGFTDVVARLVGDASQEEGVRRLTFDNGLVDDYRNGLLLREVVESGGRVLEALETTYGECALAGVPSPAELEGLGRPVVRFVCPLREDREVIEGGEAAASVTLREEKTFDGYGNVTVMANLGVVARGGVACGAACAGDESFVETEYVPPAAGGRWILERPMHMRRYTDASNAYQAESWYYYDGEAFEGLPSGQLDRGFLSRMDVREDAGSVFSQVRRRPDAHGNAAEELDPEGAPAEADAHRTTRVWEADGVLLSAQERHLKDEAGAPYRLRREYRYDASFQKVLEATEWMLVRDGAAVSPRNSVRYRYDGLGRKVAAIEAGDEGATPTQELVWSLGDPISSATVRRRTVSGGALDAEEVLCMDGRGRVYQRRELLSSGQYQVSGFDVFNNRGQVAKTHQSYLGATAACDAAPPAGVRSSEARFDALARPLEVTTPDGDLYGAPSVARFVYSPLEVQRWDLEDTAEGSPHAGTPEVQRFDGLERLVAVERQQVEGGEVVSWAWSFAYDNLGNLASWREPGGTVHRQRFDALGRAVEIDDPDAGVITRRYDRADRLVEEVDARGVTLRQRFDGANRIVARWDAADEEGTRSTWRYDLAPTGCAAELCVNPQGRAVEMTWPGGYDRMGFDVRGRVIARERQVEGATLRTRLGYDNRDRLVRTEEPDGTVLEQRWDRGERLASIPGFLSAVEYEERGLPVALRFANGGAEVSTYDSVQRLSAREVLDGAREVVESLRYARDRAGNLTRIDDLGPGQRALESRYDSWYRPTRIEVIGEVLEVGFSPDDRILSRTSSDPGSPEDLGAYRYEGAGPRAVTSAGEVMLGYDASGRLISRGGLTLERDYQGRIVGGAARGAATHRARFAQGEERVFKADADGQTWYASSTFEVRDGIGVTYVTADGRLVARRETATLQAALYDDVAPADGAITAGDAWAVWAREAGVQAGAPPKQGVEATLAAVTRRLLLEEQGEVTFLAADHLGSPVVALDEGGAVVGRRAFYPLGGLAWEEGSVDAVRGFTGQTWDGGLGLYHFRFRAYDPQTGRWDCPDPAFLLASAAAMEEPAEAAGVYGYVANNPLNAVDPLGLKGKSVKAKGKKVSKKKSKKSKGDGGDGGDSPNPGGPGGAPASGVAGSGSGASWSRGEVQGARAEGGVQIGARREARGAGSAGIGGAGQGGGDGGSGVNVFAKIGKAVLPYRGRKGKEGGDTFRGVLVSAIGLVGAGATIGVGIGGAAAFGDESAEEETGDDGSGDGGLNSIYGR